MIPSIIAGFLGGLARALYGLFKSVSEGKKVNLKHFSTTLVISAIIGWLFTFTQENPKTIALASYVGTDIIENIFKLKK